ncbi:hypothetical protein FPQ18DRAFT_260493 [Pyronema domesticum]|nr:hypothetical protein FPQ18DRAFT_260493 [Pyronema domesticum]
MLTEILGDEMEKMLQWISPLNPQQRHQDIKSERLEGTGGWFLENPDFQKWCNSQNEESSMSIFACYGIPGAGKSIICSRVIDHLLETSLDQQGQETCIAYFYCDYRDGEQYTPKNIIGGMLKQVLTTRSPSKPFTEINNIIHSLCKRQKNMRTELTLDETCQFLAQAMSYFAKVYLCIDALDECRDGHRRVLLKSLNGLRRELKQTGSICMYLTGRSNIKDEVQMSLCSDSALFSTELEANPEDIRKYILHQINMDTHKDSPMNNELQKEILDKIVDSSATMSVSRVPSYECIICT